MYQRRSCKKKQIKGENKDVRQIKEAKMVNIIRNTHAVMVTHYCASPNYMLI